MAPDISPDISRRQDMSGVVACWSEDMSGDMSGVVPRAPKICPEICPAPPRAAPEICPEICPARLDRFPEICPGNVLGQNAVPGDMSRDMPGESLFGCFDDF